jgi:general secretion pathway protein I
VKMAIRKKHHSETGTTLLEVMVAIAVASIALVSFITLVITSMDMEDQARKITEATIIAESKLNDAERGGFPEIGKTEGLVNEEEPSGFSYRQVVSETPFPEARQVEVEVFWEKKQHSVMLTTYIAKQ